ncbi:MAG: amino acid adenylation domain-containing protein [Bacteroidales bacterium]|nr:amino acid adenylation domain-containing protein [Bacteroidales bacterium]
MNDVGKKYPLSDTQYAVYTYCKAHPENAVYQICMKFGPFHGIDARRLKFAVETVINRHPIFKVRIVNDYHGSPTMQRNDDEPPIVDFLDDFQQFQNTIYLHNRLYNIAIVDDANGCTLIICVHHLIFDGYSMNIFIDEISTEYLGGTAAQEVKDFFTIIHNEIQQKKSERYQHAQDFFLQNFPPVSVRTFPPYDCFGKEYLPSSFTRQVPVTLQHWQRICEHFGFSGNVISTAIFAMVLGCFCGEDESRFSTVFHGRHGRETERTIGMFVKTIPVSATWQGDELITDLVRRIRWQSARCMVNDVYPFSEIKKNCGGFSDISFVYQGNTNHTPKFCGQDLKLSFLTPSFTGSSLSMELWFGTQNLEMTVEYDAAKYSRQLVESMIDAFSSALISIENANTIGEISFLSPKMTAKLNNFNLNARAANDDDIIKMFCKTAAENPSAIAVKYLDKSLTYCQLDELTNRLANHLISRGVGGGKRVAILTERNEMMVVLPLAVLKTGAAYVPLSPEYPDEVLQRQLKLCNADILLKDNDLDFDFPDINPPETLKNEFAIFFTSGSTGTPKGIKITHQNIVAYCQWYHRYFRPQKGCVIAAYNNFSFDASITDIFPALTSGATIAIVPQNIKKDLSSLADFCDDNNVEIIDLPTQIGRIFAANKRCKTLRHIVLGGETVAPFHNCGNYHIYNQYGPTETTVAATIYEIQGNEVSIPIGKPLDCVKIYVVDNFGRRVPVGAIGEIWIAGAQVSDGYLGVDDNCNKFIDNPFDDNPDFAHVFRTGDFGRWREDGNLEFFGRRDSLVKIRGYRIEIGELETALKQIDGVSDAAATTFEDATGALQISAFVVGNPSLDLAEIHQKLSRKLPPQMLPQSLQQIDVLPTTPNGKIDRKHLPKPISPSKTNNFIAPKSTLEKTICQAFAEVLNIVEVSADANFFEIGGTSISAMQVVVNLENKGLKIKYADIFEHPTPQELAASDWSAGIPARRTDWGAGGTPAIGRRDACTPTACTSPACASLAADFEADDTSAGGRDARTPIPILTGATGYFGAHLLKELIDNNYEKIYCIVRPKDGESADERLKKITEYYFGKSLVKSVEIIDGDIANPQIYSRLDSIITKNTTIINCAAIVKHFAEKKILQAVNVDAVKYLIDCCKKHDCNFVQISTLSAAVLPGEVVDEQTVCPLPPDAVPYAASKWQAEQLSFAAAANGLKLKLIRLGNLAPRSTDGMFQINADENAIMNFLNTVRELGCYPQSLEKQRIDFTPVDCAARDVARLISVSTSAVFHVFDTRKVAINEIVAAHAIPDEDFRQLIQKLPLQQRIPLSYFSAANHCDWNNDFTVRVLASL